MTDEQFLEDIETFQAKTGDSYIGPLVGGEVVVDGSFTVPQLKELIALLEKHGWPEKFEGRVLK